ncbi:MAG: manganese efflux pump MntP family protein [Terriglobales bacterium]
MGWWSLLAIAVALAMDAFAVAIVTGLTLRILTKRHLFRLGFHFGLFQAMMLAIGWFCGRAVHRYIGAADHWVAFGLLALVGAKIIRDAFGGEQERRSPDPTSGWDLVLLSVATSIDALAVGLSLAIVGSEIAVPALVIGVTATCLTLVGMGLGRRVGALWGRRVEVLGGVILIVIGLKILWDHTMPP